MDGTGATTSKIDKKENTIPKDHFKFIPSVGEQGLGQSVSRRGPGAPTQ